MKNSAMILWISTATIGATAALLASMPFEVAKVGLQSVFESAPEWTQVKNLYRDDNTQETSHGERPAANLSRIAGQWQDKPETRKAIFIGNSQMLTVSLAPGETIPNAPERTYPDLVAEHFRNARNSFYRLAAPGMSYTEALWYAAYLSQTSKGQPDTIFLQLNYQSFWNGGIRDGMLEMLDDKNFRAAVERLANEGKPHSETFADAIRRYDENARKAAQCKQESGCGEGDPSQSVSPGAKLESAVRDALESVPLFHQRQDHKSELMDLLYSARVYLLHIKPSTARSITGTRLWRSQSAVDEIAQLCAEKGIRLVLFEAPVNPQVLLFRSENDRRSYKDFIASLSNKYTIRVHDFADLIDKAHWGSWMNGPDPLHLSRSGHKKMADSIIALIEAEGSRT